MKPSRHQTFLFEQRSLVITFIAIALIISALSFFIGQENKFSTWFSPYWNSLTYVKSKFLQFTTDTQLHEENSKLKLNLQLLQLENDRLNTVITHEKTSLHLDALMAQVTFRSPASWNSTIWVNAGQNDNTKLGREVIAKNSPVLLGNSIIGIVEEVQSNQSRIRLITDSALSPSIRVKRINSDNQIFYLAKGYLQGSGDPLWRSRGQVLYGKGFNYDHSDEQGPARDLRTGEPLKKDTNAKQLSLIAVNDLLVTTGMDGVFPAGFEVARITKIYPLKEGDYCYEIEAKSTAGNLDDLSFVFIIPPLRP